MEILDRLRARCEQARGQGRNAQWFLLEDIEWVLAECEQVTDDNVGLMSRIEEAGDALHV